MPGRLDDKEKALTESSQSDAGLGFPEEQFRMLRTRSVMGYSLQTRSTASGWLGHKDSHDFKDVGSSSFSCCIWNWIVRQETRML